MRVTVQNVIWLLPLLWLLTIGCGRGQAQAGPWEHDPRWQHIRLAGTTRLFPVRLVEMDEPWEQVAQDVAQRLRAEASDRDVRVGFYGHGAFVPPAEVRYDVLFVAALGVAAEMDVMLFPQWRFPENNPLWDIPRQFWREHSATPLQNPATTLAEVVKSKLRKLAVENRYATAHAAVRLAAGISAFHRQRLTPALAAFSNSALVVVRLGQLLEQGNLQDGRVTLTVADEVLQDVYIANIVTFGYPLPNHSVSPALQRRLQGTFANVVPTQCWKQWSGNFLLQGAVENILVPWAPAHADWPRLASDSPEVATLGALLGGRQTIGKQGTEPPVATPTPWPFTWFKDSLCEHLRALESTLEFGPP